MHLDKHLTSWTIIKSNILKRFIPSIYRHLPGELAKLHQTSTVQEFYNKFEELSNMISRILLIFLQSYFKSGLKVDIIRKLRALQPQFLLQAFQLAKLIEDRIMETQAPTLKEEINKFHTTIIATSDNKSLFTLTTQQGKPPRRTILIQWLTLAQLDERTAKVLYFNCDGKFHKGHVWKSKLFTLKLINDEANHATNTDTTKDIPLKFCDNPKISFNAFIGQQTMRTIRLQGLAR